MDPRVQEKEMEYLKSQGIYPCDWISIPGASLCIARAGWKSPYSWWAWVEKKVIFHWIENAIKLHRINTIILIHHSRCGAYTLRYGEKFLTPAEEKRVQIYDMLLAAEKIKKKWLRLRLSFVLLWEELIDEEGKDIKFQDAAQDYFSQE